MPKPNQTALDEYLGAGSCDGRAGVSQKKTACRFFAQELHVNEGHFGEYLV